MQNSDQGVVLKVVCAQTKGDRFIRLYTEVLTQVGSTVEPLWCSAFYHQHIYSIFIFTDKICGSPKLHSALRNLTTYRTGSFITRVLVH